MALAEAASALASHVAHAPYPHEPLRQLWEKLLFNQFHDILGGACIASATRDTLETFGGVIQGAEEILNAALRRLAATVAPGPNPTAATFVVFNLTGTEQYVPVEYEPWLDRESQPRRLLDHQGNEVTYQELPPEGFVPGLNIRRLLFAPRIEPFGYRTYMVEAGEPQNPVATTLQTTQDSIESDTWRLEIDTQTGGIAQLIEKSTGRNIFTATAHLPLLVEDLSDTWGHGLDRFGVTGSSSVYERSEVIEQGPLRASIRVQARIGNSLIVSTYSLYDDPEFPLEIHVRVDWHDKNALLRLSYPLAFSAPTFRYEIPAGSIERPADGREYPGQRWVLASDQDSYGFAVANDAKYSYTALDNTLYITALRSPVYAHHIPYVLQAENEYLYTDQGEQEFTLRLQAGKGVTAQTAHRLADGLLRGPVVTPHVSRSGNGPHSGSLLSINAQSSLVTWLKQAEDGHGLVLRLLEVEGKSDTVVIADDKQIHEIKPYGLMTLRNDDTDQWRASNGLEDTL